MASAWEHGMPVLPRRHPVPTTDNRPALKTLCDTSAFECCQQSQIIKYILTQIIWPTSTSNNQAQCTVHTVGIFAAKLQRQYQYSLIRYYFAFNALHNNPHQVGGNCGIYYISYKCISAFLSHLTSLNDSIVLGTSDIQAYRTRTLTFTHN